MLLLFFKFNNTTKRDGSSDGLGLGVIIGIAAGGGAALLVFIITIICCCYCYHKRHQEDTYTIGPTVTAR